MWPASRVETSHQRRREQQHSTQTHRLKLYREIIFLLEMAYMLYIEILSLIFWDISIWNFHPSWSSFFQEFIDILKNYKSSV